MKNNNKQKFMYSGTLENYQLSNQIKNVMQYEYDSYTPYQNYLYKRALFGLNSLTEIEINTICNKKKQRINNVYKRAQVVLNNFKQQVTINYSNFIFKTLFPNSPITDFLITEVETDDKFINTLNFKDLNISKDDIICIFMQEGILPKNFLSLKEAQINLNK
jgi:hypothetical protein